MKTENTKLKYLSLCLDQASNSPLHYRHGCIVVRGGKVIGQGFNDYRPGFDRGALKDGRIASGPRDSSHKQKHKQKFKSGTKSIDAGPIKPFTPFEGMGGGHRANVPLSMHSEMMAIHSALAQSSTLACKRDSKRTSRRSAAALSPSSTPPSSAPARLKFKSGVLKPLHLDQTVLNLTENEKNEEEDVAAPAWNGVEKHRMKDSKIGHHGKQYRYHQQHQYQYDRSGQQVAQHKQYAFKSDAGRTGNGSVPGAEYFGSLSSKTSQTGRKVEARKAKSLDHPPTKKTPDKGGTSSSQAMLLSRGHTAQSSRSVAERMKNPRLNGADLYVARLGWRRHDAKRVSTTAVGDPKICSNMENKAEDCLVEDGSVPEVAPTPAPSLAGSLHDELTCVSRSPPPPETTEPELFDRSVVHASRPCYRCISYMHSVGIRRVFWTTEGGEWEGAKVRDLVDALEMAGCAQEGDGPGAGSGGVAVSGVFVTKHEILMLRRMMGARQS